MVELSNDSPAWSHYLDHINDLFNRQPRMATVEAVSEVLNREHNGLARDGGHRWRVYFKNEADLLLFVLKWS